MQLIAQSITRLCAISIMVLITISVAGCATSDGGYSSTRSSGSKVLACKSGDQLVSSSTQCLQDSAACYELSSGKWCTGERGNTCPAGSAQIPDGAACPSGTRCIQFGESLNCAIQIR